MLNYKPRVTRLVNRIAKVARAGDQSEIDRARRELNRIVASAAKALTVDQARRIVEEKEGWTNITIPAIQFPPSWKVSVMPPRHGAIVRFRVSNGRREVDVAADFFSRLCDKTEPYWQVTPGKDDWFDLYPLDDTDDLIAGIKVAMGEKLIGV
jgi:hypothetical protein